MINKLLSSIRKSPRKKKEVRKIRLERYLLSGSRRGGLSSILDEAGIIDFLKKATTERDCTREIIKVNKVRCHKCKSKNCVLSRKKKSMLCKDCLAQTSVLKGTMFAKTHVQLVIWFYMMSRMMDMGRRITVATLSRETGLSYPTALNMFHKIKDNIYNPRMNQNKTSAKVGLYKLEVEIRRIA